MSIKILFSVCFPFHRRKANKLRQCNAVTKEMNFCSTHQFWSTFNLSLQENNDDDGDGDDNYDRIFGEYVVNEAENRQR